MDQFKAVPDNSILFDLSPEEVVFLFFYLGIAISPSLTIDELNVFANGLFETAQVLFVIAAQRTLLNDFIEEQQKKKEAEKKDTEKPEEPNRSVQELESDIRHLKEEIKYLKQQINALTK